MTDRFYLMGVCGMGMAPLAAFLKDGGNDVLGFDDTPNPDILHALENDGVKFEKPFRFGAERKVVISTALARRAAEIRRETGCDEIERRGERWAKICAERRLTAVVGSHGKSTVSALLAHAGLKLGADFGYLVGAIPTGFAMHKFCNKGKTITSEIDESDGTIEKFSPEITVALNADLDHTDTYADEDRLREMFERLFSRTKRAIVYPESDEILAEAAQKSGKKCVPVKTGGSFTKINISMARAAAAETFGTEIPEGIFDDFKGLARRQETLADSIRLVAVADYAHHPNEVKSFLQWFDGKYAQCRRIAVFQPHRYTRTRRFAKDFARILSESGSRTLLLPVYPASEPFDALGESAEIAKLSEKIELVEDEDFFRIVNDAANDSEMRRIAVAVVGAGDFYFSAKEFFKQYK